MKTFFDFTLQEQRGIFVLLLLCIASIGYRFWPMSQKNYKIELIYDQLESNTDTTADFAHSTIRTKRHARTWKLQNFDPNYAKASDLRVMGFSNEFINHWFELKQSVGFVKNQHEFVSLNLLTPSELEIVLPFLNFERYVQRKTWPKKKVLFVKQVLDINVVDSVALKALPGIGNKLSKRIIKYRESLGGFQNIKQLKEVYGIDSQLYSKLSSRVLTNGLSRKIDINAANLESFKKHPYIDYKTSRAIISYREQHGRFNEVTDLLNIYLVDTLWLEKAAPYLKAD
ncbi:MAG: competence protein ComEA [Bacteroidia bacterium]|jgi:competence protein ComEA